MNPTLEKIKEEIRALPATDRGDLLRELSQEFDSTDDEAVEAAWDEEIAARIKEIEEGKVELISAEESTRQIDLLFGELGIPRKAHGA